MEKTIDSIFNEFNEDVKTSFPSIFSKEDVLSLLNDLKQQISTVKQEDIDFNKIKEDVIGVLENFDYDDDIDVNIGYDRRVEVSFNEDSLVREVEIAFDHQFKSESH
jgi:hypothetical protein